MSDSPRVTVTTGKNGYVTVCFGETCVTVACPAAVGLPETPDKPTIPQIPVFSPVNPPLGFRFDTDLPHELSELQVAHIDTTSDEPLLLEVTNADSVDAERLSTIAGQVWERSERATVVRLVE
jgi:hypothetical protein